MTDPKTDKTADAKAAEAKAADTKAAERKSTSTSTGKVGTYQVTAPYVTLRSKDATGADVVLGYFEGAIVPDSVDLESLASHIRKGMVAKVEGDELKAVKAQQDTDAKAAEQAEAPVDKEGAEAVADAEAQVKDAEDAEKAADAEAKKTRTPRIKASDSPRGLTTAQQG
jgi:hypothetical protein